MTTRRELAAFAAVLAVCVGGLFGESLFLGKVLSPADVLLASAGFRDLAGEDYEPSNKLLIDPALQFQPWLEFNRAMLRRGRLPLWNDLAGCGAPHLANAQSAPFDPFHLIAYLGNLPDAYARMAAARLWFAGLGTFLLARSWGLGPWGRWFAGLTFPFCGFLVVWLLYPVTASAVWMPWLFLATDRVLDRPDARGAGLLGLAVGGLFLAGHVQTSAHALLAGGAYALWRLRGVGPFGAGTVGWGAGVALGLGLASITVVPLAVYLGKSPVWSDREHDRPSPWRLTAPRLLDAACTAVPYAFGSQRRGHPNLARGLGVHNLNESAGGFAGLATLVWLAPQGWLARRRQARATFLAGLAGVGLLGAFGVPPVVNALRAAPLLNVTDLRRLTLWAAFGLALLGGVGLDHLDLAWPRRVSRWWVSTGVALALAMALGASAVPAFGPWLRDRASRHYARSATATKGADPGRDRRLADRQVRRALDHLPRVLLGTAASLAMLGALAVLARRGSIPRDAARLALGSFTVAELLAFGFGLNPAIDRRLDRPEGALVEYLRREVGNRGRVLGVGAELPPNLAMRYGLADVRNYDSVELTRSLDWFEPLYEPDPRMRSSRRAVTWAGVARARGRLAGAGVLAVVGAAPPPEGLFERVDKVGDVWVARPGAGPLCASAGGAALAAGFDSGTISVLTNFSSEDMIIIRQTFDPGWRAEVDGRAAGVAPHLGTFLSVRVPAGARRVRLRYDPPEARAAAAFSLLSALAVAAALCGAGPRRRGVFPAKGLEALAAAG